MRSASGARDGRSPDGGAAESGVPAVDIDVAAKPALGGIEDGGAGADSGTSAGRCSVEMAACDGPG